MEYIHIRNLEKYHPGYKDRELKWAKIYFVMAQGDPDCELIENEIDWARLIKLILLELEAKKPLPNIDHYWGKKGFDVKKRPMSLTLQMLHNFVEVVTQDSKLCAIEKSREEKNKIREEIDKEGCFTTFVTETTNQWNSLCEKFPIISKVNSISGSRRSHLKSRFAESGFNWAGVLEQIGLSKFLQGNNDRKWVVSFDWLIKNDTNYLKVLEGRYREKGDTIEDEIEKNRKR